MGITYLEGTLPMRLARVLSLILHRAASVPSTNDDSVSKLHTPSKTSSRHRCQGRVHQPNYESKMSCHCETYVRVKNSGREQPSYLPGTPCNKYPRRKGIPKTIKVQNRQQVGLRTLADLARHTCGGMSPVSHTSTPRQGDGTYQSSEHRKSLQSARIISLTPGSRTIELMGRFCLAPFHLQHP